MKHTTFINGACQATTCKQNYHLSSDRKSCIPNSETACGTTTSPTTQNCTAIQNAMTTTCNAGTCKVTACASGYHPNSGYTACTVNSATACGTTTSATTQNCDTTINNSASTKCDAGTCKVTKCASGYHPNSDYTGCVANSSTACGTTTSSTTKNCSTSITNSAATERAKARDRLE